jgi:hypothetical protein
MDSTACTFWVIRSSRVGAIRVKIGIWAVYGAFLAAPGQRLNSAPYFFDTGLVAYGMVWWPADRKISRRWD